MAGGGKDTKVGGRRDCIFLLLDIVPVGFLNCAGGRSEWVPVGFLKFLILALQ